VKYSRQLIIVEDLPMANMKMELQPESTGLVIVDMQVEGCERHGPGMKPVIDNIRRLLERFRAANGKIIHVQSVRTTDHPEFTVFGRPYGSSSAHRARISSTSCGRSKARTSCRNPPMTVSTKPRWTPCWKSLTCGRAGTKLSSLASVRVTAFIMR